MLVSRARVDSEPTTSHEHVSRSRQAPRLKNYVGNILPANGDELRAGLGSRRLGPAEVTAAVGNATIIFSFITEGFDIVVEIGIQSFQHVAPYQFRKLVQRHRGFRLAAVAFAIRARALVELLYALTVTSRGYLRIAGEADAENLRGLFFDQNASSVIQRFHMVQIAMSVQNDQAIKLVTK